MRPTSVMYCAALVLVLGARAQAGVYDLESQWSDAANPNGVWTYRAGSVVVPHVSSWQSTIGGWNSAQPGWAFSENGNERVPFFFKSNGSENFVHDFQANDTVVHTTDLGSGGVNGNANYLWTSPDTGTVNITGGVWMGRDIDRGNHWELAKNGVVLTAGDISSGDAFSRAAPFDFSAGTGGSSAVNNVSIAAGDQITLTLSRTGEFGDFVGTNFTLTTTLAPEPMGLGIAALACGVMQVRRPRRRV